MRDSFQKIGPLFRTVRYLRPQQILARLSYRIRRLYYQTPFYPALLEEPDYPAFFSYQAPDLWAGDPKVGEEIIGNHFTFVGRTVSMVNGMDWYPKDTSALWAYNLHYFGWLNDLKVCDAAGHKQAMALMENWFENCSQFHPLSWHPYPLSLRIINWTIHGPWLIEGADTDFKELFFASLSQQVSLLERCIEWDVGGNHLIKNLKALIYAGLCLPQRQTVYLDALNLLLEQLKLQILPDGSHYERSPHYHVDVLIDILDIHALIRRVGHVPPPQLDDVIDRMGTALAFYTYPDGQLALFNDGAIGEKAHIANVLKRCGQDDALPVQLADAGYTRLERGNTLVMVDHAACCPDDLPAHAHADTLSFEMLYDDERIFVNTGTFAYQHPLRNSFRGTAAHNTVVVDREDSAEVWGAFRLGRRPTLIRSTVREEENTGVGLDMSHNGYRHKGVIHHRKIFMSDDGTDIRGEDLICRKKGKDTHHITAHFHLHPNVRYEMKSMNEAVIETAKGVKFKLKISGGRLYDAESKYAPQFGEMIPSRQIIIRGVWENDSCTLRWALKKL